MLHVDVPAVTRRGHVRTLVVALAVAAAAYLAPALLAPGAVRTLEPAEP